MTYDLNETNLPGVPYSFDDASVVALAAHLCSCIHINFFSFHSCISALGLADEIANALAQRQYNLYILFMLFSEWLLFFFLFLFLGLARPLALICEYSGDYTNLITLIHTPHEIKCNE